MYRKEFLVDTMRCHGRETRNQIRVHISRLESDFCYTLKTPEPGSSRASLDTTLRPTSLLRSVMRGVLEIITPTPAASPVILLPPCRVVLWAPRAESGKS